MWAPFAAAAENYLPLLQAPVGTASIVFMKATGVAMLSAWDAAITKAALQLYHSTVTELVPQYSGYIVEMAEELSLLAFQRPEAAIAWALAARERLLAADWPQELLEHELCEPITTTLVAAAAVSHSHFLPPRLGMNLRTQAQHSTRTHVCMNVRMWWPYNAGVAVGACASGSG